VWPRSADSHSVWLLWVLTAWLVVGALFGVVIGRGIRSADRRSREAAVLAAAGRAAFAVAG
jgi:hypothetical protein